MGQARLRPNPIRVLLSISSMHPRNGGPPTVLAGTALALKRKGVSVELASRCPADEVDFVRKAWPDLSAAQIPMHLFAPSGLNGLLRSRSFNQFVESNSQRFDLLHAHGVWEGVMADGARIFRRHGKPYFVSVHGTLDPWSLARSRWKKALSARFLGTRKFLNTAEGVIFGTADEAQSASLPGLDARKLVVPNGVHLADLDLDLGAGRRALQQRFPQLREWDKTILFFSRIHPKKGLDVLVEAFARVAENFPQSGILAAAIPEDRTYENHVRSRIARLGLERRILITTDLVGRDARQVLGAADIFALPSHQEGFSMAIIEAMAVGLPVLITDKCHLNEVADLGAGVVVPATPEGLSLGLSDLLSRDRNGLKEMGRRGTALVSREYTWEKVADKLIRVYSRRTDDDPA